MVCRLTSLTSVGLKNGSQVTGHRSQVTGHRLQVTCHISQVTKIPVIFQIYSRFSFFFGGWGGV